MKHPFYLKALLAYAVLALLSFFVTASLGRQLIEDRTVSSLASQEYEAVNALSPSALEICLGSSDAENGKNELSAAASASGFTFRVIDTSGNLIFSTADPSLTEPRKIEGFDYASFGPGYYTKGGFFGLDGEDGLHVLLPLTSSYRTGGYIASSVSFSEAASRRDRYLLPCYIVTAVNALLALLLLAFLDLSIYRPLRRIRDGARQFAAGNFSHRIDVVQNDEIGELAGTLNVMAQDLKKNNEYQQQFISNISHDFRSPLTSIKGFTEAMSDGTIPPELHPHYLSVISGEADRLKKLTESILTLNSMHPDSVVLKMSEFDINELLRGTAEVFEGSCRKKKISISLLLTGEKLTVRADRGKIGQVAYNLLDNAVKFSDRGGLIEIETSIRRGECTVAVRDNGCGIEPDALPKIWDRFYKSDASRGRDKTGSGLGLSIVREIINAHGQTITVTSTVGAGTEFVFTLELAE